MATEFDPEVLTQNAAILAENQKVTFEKLTSLEQALKDALTPKEVKEAEAKKKELTIEEYEKLRLKEKEDEKKEKQEQTFIEQATQAAEAKLDEAEESLQEFLKANELEYDDDAKELFDDFASKFIDKGLKEQKDSGTKSFDWKAFNARMEEKFSKLYKISKKDSEDVEKPGKDAKEKAFKQAKSLTNFSDEVISLEKSSEFDKLAGKIEAHNRVTNGTPKPGDVKMTRDEMIEIHSKLSRFNNRMKAKAEV